LNATFETALSRLPAEDAAIVRLKYVEGLSNADIERAVGATGVTTSRLQDILRRLRSALVSLGVDARDIALVRGQP
jgi:DNA-directed RNA polymerase specialized sigma24 family protein